MQVVVEKLFHAKFSIAAGHCAGSEAPFAFAHCMEMEQKTVLRLC
eukprot:COSAG01_NODE_24742_length_768_cov_1.147982_1_plen_44_part_10